MYTYLYIFFIYKNYIGFGDVGKRLSGFRLQRFTVYINVGLLNLGHVLSMED